MNSCQYHRICAMYEYNSFNCTIFHNKCKYHHEFGWYDKQVVTKHTDRIRMEQVRALEKEFNVAEHIKANLIDVIKSYERICSDGKCSKRD